LLVRRAPPDAGHPPVGSRPDPPGGASPPLPPRPPRLQVEPFPGYAPELNPAEFVWTQAKRALANSAPADLPDLQRWLRQATRRLVRSQDLLWACIAMSDLPWLR